MKRRTLLQGFCIFLLFTHPVRAQIPTSGLVAYWPMNGNFNDAGPSALNGTNFSATATANKAGTAGAAMDFNNPTTTVAQYATHPVNAALNFSSTQNFTFSYLMRLKSPWVHNGGYYDYGINYGGYGAWNWVIGANVVVQFIFRNNSVSSGAIPLNVWKHITCVRNNGTLSIYVDGVLSGSGTEGTATPNYMYPGRIGSMYYFPQTPPQYNGLHGAMDELRIYNRALSLAEITGLAATTLPLKLDQFSVALSNGKANLNWTTLQETNSSHFEIERSADGNNFTTIGRKQAMGNSGSSTRYAFTDDQPLSGTGYYRLKLVDLDGTFSYSRVAVIKTTIGKPLELYPNPARDQIQALLTVKEKGVYTIRVTNLQGKTVQQKQLDLETGITTIPLFIGTLNPGIYEYQISHSAQEVLRSRFVKAE